MALSSRVSQLHAYALLRCCRMISKANKKLGRPRSKTTNLSKKNNSISSQIYNLMSEVHASLMELVSSFHCTTNRNCTNAAGYNV